MSGQESERPFIRPSSLQVAEKCSRAPWLAHKYREENQVMRVGKGVDADVSIALVEGGEPQSKEGRELIAWLRRRFGPSAKYFVQRKVFLFDPVTGERITEGTPDLLVIVGDRLYVVDWKKKGQLWSGHLAMPNDNLQQQAYGVAAGMEFRVEDLQIVLACFDERGITPIEGRVVNGEGWWAFIDRIKAIPPVDFDGPEPAAITGDHCDGCWQKNHCSAYLLPALRDIPDALVPFSEGKTLALTEEQVLAGLEWLEQADLVMSRAQRIRKMVLSQLETYAVTVGPIRKDGHEWGPIPTNGSRSGATVGELEALGLKNLIKPAVPKVKFDWKKVA